MKRGFTLIELLVVISIIGILSVVVLPLFQGATGNARGVTTASTKRQLTKAAQYYELDMGFYPPDVSRGWDPGFERQDPWNPDVESGAYEGTAGIDCGHCPDDWETLLAERWNGPYILWPQKTAWGGRFDYNYWPDGEERYGCILSPGIYAGAQRDYDEENNIPEVDEQRMIEQGIDDDECVNGESQLLLFKL